MSRLWHFYSYSQPTFDAYLGGGRTNAAEEIVAASTWDEDAWSELQSVHHLCSMIAQRGINYGELSPSEAARLDELLPVLFAPEGLEGQWGVAAESPDGLHPAVVRELVTRAGGASLLPILLGGRRYGVAKPSACGYCFLAPAECEQLTAEAERALASEGLWSGDWLPGVVSECLIVPLRSAVSKKRPMFGSLA